MGILYQESCCDAVPTGDFPLGLIAGCACLAIVMLSILAFLLAWCCRAKPEPRICPQPVYVEPAYTEVVYEDDVYEDVLPAVRPMLATAPYEEVYEDEYVPEQQVQVINETEFVEEPEFVQPYGAALEYGDLTSRPIARGLRRRSIKRPSIKRRSLRRPVRRPIRRV